MGKKQNKKITLTDLIKNKEQFDKSKKAKETKTLFIESLEGVIEIQKPSKSLCLESLDMGYEEGDRYMVYECVVEPNLKDKKLQEAYGCVSPTDIVEKVFEIGEIASIAKECIYFAGYGDSVKVVNDIKNE